MRCLEQGKGAWPRESLGELYKVGVSLEPKWLRSSYFKQVSYLEYWADGCLGTLACYGEYLGRKAEGGL